jgi:hypothetical protein
MVVDDSGEPLWPLWRRRLSCGLFEAREPNEPEIPTQSCRPASRAALRSRSTSRTPTDARALLNCYASMLDHHVRVSSRQDAQDSLQNPIAFAGWEGAGVCTGRTIRLTGREPPGGRSSNVDFVNEISHGHQRAGRKLREVRISMSTSSELRRTGPPQIRRFARYTGLADIHVSIAVRMRQRQIASGRIIRGSVSGLHLGNLLRSNQLSRGLNGLSFGLKSLRTVSSYRGG